VSATVPEIATALQAALETITGLRALPYLGDSFSTPAALVAWEDADYHGAFGYSDNLNRFTIFLILTRSSDRASLEAMEGYVSTSGATSIRAAIESDPTLGGVVSTSIVVKSGPPSAIQIGQSGAVYLGVPFAVETHS